MQTITAYIDAALQGELAAIRRAPAGRNNTFFASSARLYEFVEAGALDEAMLSDLLAAEGAALGLPRAEVRATLKSARKAARGKPAHGQTPRRAQLGYVRSAPACVPPDDAHDPPPAWQTAAAAFLDWSHDRLWDAADERGLDYLTSRGLNDLAAWNGWLGYNPQRLIRSRARWGLPRDDERGDDLYLPAGLVIPYLVERRVVKLEIRALHCGRKYTVPGSTNALWGVDRLRSHRVAILVEGVLNALSVLQVAGDLVTPLAIGATTHARRVRWVAQLATVPLVFIATDAGAAGEAAAAYWCDVLRHNARRWRPYVDDANTMLQAGMDLRAWVYAGLSAS